MQRTLVGLYTYAEFGLATLVFLPVLGVASYLHRGDPTRRIPGRWMRRFGKTTSKLTPLWDFSVQGEAPNDIQTRAYVVVANHESLADPFLLSHLPWDMRWVSKEEIFKLPVLGWMMRFGGDISLKRGDRGSVEEMFAECKRTLEGGMSVMMFPEGTRSRDGTLLPFKPGAFELAISAHVPVLPIVTTGTRACMPKGSKWLGNARAIARILQPIETTGLGPEDAPALAARTREVIRRERDALREELETSAH